MSNKKQMTAVEWLIDQIEENIEDIPTGVKEQAKQMEKEQMINAYIAGLTPQVVYNSEKSQAEQYYNEIYETN